VIWLENGLVRADGPAEYVLKLYEEDFRRKEDETTRQGNIARRSELASLPSLGELEASTAHRLRLVPAPERATFADTHYVRRVAVGLDGASAQDLDLALPENAGTHQLDVLGSEWGRLYARGERECRLLAARTGKLKGGQIVVHVPDAAQDATVEVIVEAQSELGSEALMLEYLDVRQGEWRAAESRSHDAIDANWNRHHWACTLRGASGVDRQALVERIHAAHRPDIEVREVTLCNASGSTHTVREREPFHIVVQLTVHRETETADVGIRIMRRDGVYVFWQSSGLIGQSLREVRANTIVTFDFSENPLGQGEYLLSAYVANAWDFPANYPYSQVFDRKVNCLLFSVTNELPGLDFGVLNARVPVHVSSEAC
jgi:lipopolysaccharide transport system ATP-binding protein